MNGKPNSGTFSEFDTDHVRRIISPIVRLLDAPEELCEIFPVLEQFQTVLRLYQPLSNESELRGIGKIEELIDRILSGDIEVLKYIPSARTRKNRQTLKPYYEDHAHYCTYWHRCSPNLEPQYHALLASLLPVQTRLQQSKRESESFVERSYHLGLSIRQLTEPNEVETRILKQIPTEALPPKQLLEFLEGLFERYGYIFKTTGLLRTWAYIHRALSWYQSGEWEQKKKWLHKRGYRKESPRHGGLALDRDREIQEVSSHQLEQGGSRTTRTFYADTGGLHGIEKQDIDADPIQDSGKLFEKIEIPTQKSTQFNLVDRVLINKRKARYAAQAIEMGNQRLPVTHATMSGFELKVLLDAFSNIESDVWESVPRKMRSKVAAWCSSRFFLGRAPEDLMKTHVVDMNEDGDDIMRAKWDPETRTMWLPCQLPLHKAPNDRWRVLQPKPGFNLDLSNTLAPYLSKVTKNTQKLFMKDHETEFTQLVSKLNQIYGTNLTVNRITNTIPLLMAQLAPGDEVIALYFAGRKPNQHNPCVYSAIPASRLASLFSQACERVFELAQVSRDSLQLPAFPSLISGEDDFVGSFHVPTIDTLQTTIQDVLDRIENLKAQPGTPVHELHNMYTAYLLLFLMATTAIRAVRQPIPSEFNIDKITGSCFVSEKDTDGYRNARVVWLHPLLIRQLEEYERHVVRIRQHIAIKNANALDNFDAKNEIYKLTSASAPDRTNDQERLQVKSPMLFMMSEYGGHAIDIEPKKIEELLGQHWKLRLVSLRHFIRTELLISGCSGVVINALLGHAERGESPWGKFSTLPPVLWRDQLKGHLDPILERLKFRIVGSPLLRS